MANDPTSKISAKEFDKQVAYNPLTYPYDLGQDGNGETKAICFKAFKYNKEISGRFELKEPVATFYLPVPLNLNSGDAMDYEDFSATMLQNVLGAAKSALTGGETTMDNILGAVGAGLVALGKSDAKLAEATAGVIVNPRNANVLKSPKSREYQFVYKMVAVNEEESRRINEIVNRFRYYAYPDVSESEAFFVAPEIFEIDIINKVGDTWIKNPYMFSPLPCALVAMNVAYNDSAPVSFFMKSGAPVEVVLTLNFLEMELDNKAQLRKPNRYGSLSGMTPVTPTSLEELKSKLKSLS